VEIIEEPGYKGVLRLSSKWRPTREQIAAFEAALSDEVARHPLGRPLAQYVRSYYGALDGRRQRLHVYVTCEPGSRWRQGEFLHAMGGGDCFLDVVWDPATGRILSLVPNSER
jgi:hypothetical protein